MKSVCAVICEYNPMHLGHVRHLAETRRQSGCDAVALIMSGSVVQRGEFAFLDKFTRTEIALANGADLVLELPTAFACAAADDFALYAVKIADALPFVTHLSFGSGCGEVGKLLKAREILDREEFRGALCENLNAGNSYAGAYRAAARNALESQGLGEILSDSNDLLALSYLKAIRATGANLSPVAIKRSGRYNSEELPDSPLGISASAVRKFADDPKIAAFVPEETLRALAKRTAVSETEYYAMLRARLLATSPEELKKVAGMGEGLENRLRAKCGAPDFAAYLDAVSTKRYSRSRIRRTLLRALLGITEDLLGRAKQASPLLRVLGVKKGREELLSGYPAFLSPAEISSLSSPLDELAALDSLAFNLRALLSAPEDFNREYTRGLIKI